MLTIIDCQRRSSQFIIYYLRSTLVCVALSVLLNWFFLFGGSSLERSFLFQPCLANDLPLPFSLYQASCHITLDQNLLLGPPAHCKDLKMGRYVAIIRACDKDLPKKTFNADRRPVLFNLLPPFQSFRMDAPSRTRALNPKTRKLMEAKAN